MRVDERTRWALSNDTLNEPSEADQVMDKEVFEPTIKTSIDDVYSPIDNPGVLVEATPGGESRFFLDRSIIIIGSDDAADVRIEDRGIASYHAEIVHDGGEYEIRHLDGSAPVCVNGEVVRETALADGDAIAVGDRAFTFVRQPAAVTTD